MKLKPLLLILVYSLASLAIAEDPSPASCDKFDEARAILKDTPESEELANKAFLMLKESAESGHAPAMGALAYLYDVGLGTGKDPKTALDWYRRAAESGDSTSMFNLGYTLLNTRQGPDEPAESVYQRFAEGVDWYRRAADLGLTRACSAYGIILMRGDYRTPVNATEAVKYLHRAAEEQDLEAINALAVMYRNGNGVRRDLGMAESLFRSAAQRGHVKAQANLGSLLDTTNPDQTLRAEAIAWLLLAERGGDITAKRILNTRKQVMPPAHLNAGKMRMEQLVREFDL